VITSKQMTLAFTSPDRTLLLEATKCFGCGCLPDPSGLCQRPHRSVEELRFGQDCEQSPVPGSANAADPFGHPVGSSPFDLHDVIPTDGEMAVSGSIDEKDPFLCEVVSHRGCDVWGKENPWMPSLAMHLRNGAISNGVGQMRPLFFNQKAMFALRSCDQKESVRLGPVSGGINLEDLGLLNEGQVP